MALTLRSRIKSVGRFGIVGVATTLVYALLFVLLVSYVGLSGLCANLLTYGPALAVSYFGQSRWTFADRQNRSVTWFLITALVSFGLSNGGAWLIVDKWKLSPAWMLPVLAVIPLVSYMMMRTWAFTHARSRAE